VFTKSFFSQIVEEQKQEKLKRDIVIAMSKKKLFTIIGKEPLEEPKYLYDTAPKKSEMISGSSEWLKKMASGKRRDSFPCSRKRISVIFYAFNNVSFPLPSRYHSL
jgi:hypothetical protein